MSDLYETLLEQVRDVEVRKMSAWTVFYKYGLSADPDTQLAYSIVAVKEELVHVGFAQGITDAAIFGNYARDRTIDFQASEGIVADGVVGPVTARHLFNHRCQEVEQLNGIPDKLLCKLKTHESTDDPNAVGFVDRDDHGLVQINLRAHPTVTLRQAVDPAFCLPWAAQRLKEAFVTLHDWDAVLVSWNQGGFYAAKWLAAGKPSSGGPLVFFGNEWHDRWKLAFQYVLDIRKQPT